MSTLPAASSFSGSDGSAGACGLTSRPTGAEVAVGDRRVERRVVGVREEVEHHRERLRPGRRERVLLGAAGRQRERRAERERGRRQVPHPPGARAERGVVGGGAAGTRRESQGVSPVCR